MCAQNIYVVCCFSEFLFSKGNAVTDFHQLFIQSVSKLLYQLPVNNQIIKYKKIVKVKSIKFSGSVPKVGSCSGDCNLLAINLVSNKFIRWVSALIFIIFKRNKNNVEIMIIMILFQRLVMVKLCFHVSLKIWFPKLQVTFDWYICICGDSSVWDKSVNEFLINSNQFDKL